jgi:hypothetical protein
MMDPLVRWPGFRGCCGRFCQGHLERKWRGASSVPQPPREVGRGVSKLLSFLADLLSC